MERWGLRIPVVMISGMRMIDFLVSPLQYAFMTRAFIGAMIVGVVCAVVGTYVVLRGMAFFGDALAHAILPGVAIGYLIGSGASGPIFWGAMIAALISSFGIGVISRVSNLKEDTAIGVIFSGMFALGIVLISTVHDYTADLSHVLFGNILGVTPADLRLISMLGSVVLALVLFFYKEFLVISFDPILGKTLRLPMRSLENLLIFLISVTIVISLQTVGIILMVAMLITPAATAYLVTKRLPNMMALAAIIAALSGVVGLYASYYANIASGAAIVLMATLTFIITWLLKTLAQRIMR